MPSKESAPLPHQPHRTARPVLWAGGTAIAGLIGHKLHNYMPAGWRGDSGLWDVWSHISNVPDSMMAVSTGIMATALARKELFSAVPLRRACGTAATGLALGFGANAVFETPLTADTALMQEAFPGSRPDPLDELYGDTASLLSAALLATAMREHRRPVETLGITEIPGLPHSDNA